MAQLFKNNIFGVLQSGIGNSATSMTLTDASSFPAPTGGDHYLVTLVGFGSNGSENAWEIVKVTAKASNTLTVVRAQEGTTAVSWPGAAQVQMRLTAGSLDTKVDKIVGKGLSTEDYSTAEKSKLAAVAAGATANATNAELRDRATHTGEQAISTVTGLQSALNGKEAAGVAASAVSAHTAAGDPHPQYTTAAEAASAAPVQSVAGRVGAVVITKADVGLGSVDNTSDANKPVSTAQQTALNLKADLAGPALTGAPTAPTATQGTNTTQIATTAFVNAEIAADAAPIDHVGSGGAAHANAVASGADGFMTGADKAKLDGVAAGANNYTHPANHPPSIITQDASNRFVTDAEKAAWNAKQPLDADLTAIAALAGTSGLLKKTAADTWTLDTTAYTTNTGTVTSVGVSVPTGLSVTGSPVTASGTIAIALASGYSIPTTAKQTNWDSAYGWGNHASAGYSTLTLGSTAGAALAASGSAGSATTAAKSDHVHPFPTAANVGAVAASGGAASGLTLNDGYTEEVFDVTGTTPALSPTNGSIQTWTLTGNSTPTAGTWASGQSMTLMVDDGSAYTINWASMSITWKTGGGTAPTLLTSGYTVIELAKVGSTIYGWLAGDA